VDESNPNGVLPASSGQPSSAAAAPAAASSSKPAAAVAAAPAAADKPAKAEKPKSESKKAAPAKAAAAPAAAAEDPNQPAYTKLDIRVGQIVSAARHPNPEVTSLYVEQIDVGDASGPRQILSGLAQLIPLAEFSTSKCLVVCNLKPGNLQGQLSNGMVLCASVGEGAARQVELIQPPAGSKPGDRIVPLTGDFAAWKPLEVVDAKKKNKKVRQATERARWLHRTRMRTCPSTRFAHFACLWRTSPLRRRTCPRTLGRTPPRISRRTRRRRRRGMDTCSASTDSRHSRSRSRMPRSRKQRRGDR
jgi:methionine--tRNA ligase beta chain